LLEVTAYDSVVRPSGEDAMEVLKHEDVDCVMTDKRLPGIDGVELLRVDPASFSSKLARYGLAKHER